MQLTRGYVSKLQPDAREEVLRRHGLDAGSLLGVGTEAEVYALDDDTVIKLYSDPSREDHLRVLQEFYASLDTRQLPFALPKIGGIDVMSGVLVVREQRIDGLPMDRAIATRGPSRQFEFVPTYLDTVLSLGEVQVRADIGRYLLFDSDNSSSVQKSDWYEFVYRLTLDKTTRRRELLCGDIPELGDKLDHLATLSRSGVYDSSLQLVHGDFLPANILVSNSGEVKGVVDFGGFTMFGDPVYDVALACIFYDMYGPNAKEARAFLFDRAVERLGSQSRGLMFRYAASYALASCDMYGEEETMRQDDHYQWATSLLSEPSLWESMA